MEESVSTESSEPTWFYENNGERKEAAQSYIKELIKKRILNSESLVWRKGYQSWVKLKNTELNNYFSNISDIPPPLPIPHADNSLIWLLAFAPIIGYFLESILSDIFSTNTFFSDSHEKYWFVSLLLNSFLAYYDEDKLKKSGIDTEKFCPKFFVWLVPVYLYQRSKFLKQDMSYFIVWIVSALLIYSNN